MRESNSDDRSICFVLPSAYGYFSDEADAVGGGARQLSFVSRALADDYDVHFVVENCGQGATEVVDKVTLQRSYTPSVESSPVRQVRQLAQYFAAMRRADADVYVYRGKVKKAVITYFLTRLLGKRWVYTLGNDSNLGREVESLPRYYQLLLNRAIRGADALVAQTEPQAEQLRVSYGVSAKIIPSGYPEAEGVSPPIDREYFLWVGRLEPNQKRPGVFLDMAARLPEYRFILVGPHGNDRSYAEQIERRAEELKNVSYTGRVPPADVHGFYRDAIALVNTSAYEGFPSTFLEAWRMHTPVVSLSVDPTRYTDGAGAEGFASGRPERLVKLLDRLATDQAFRVNLSTATHEYFRRQLTMDKITSDYRRLFGSVLGETNHSA